MDNSILWSRLPLMKMPDLKIIMQVVMIMMFHQDVARLDQLDATLMETQNPLSQNETETSPQNVDNT